MSELLESINGPEDLKRLNVSQLGRLAEEIGRVGGLLGRLWAEA